MAEKTTKTIRIKWVRSGIGFPYTQKGIVRSLGLRKLNQVVERPDTPQIRGIVAKVPHLLAIVEPPLAPVLATIPEYTVRPPEVAPAVKAEASVETPAGEEAPAAISGEGEHSVEEAELPEEAEDRKQAAAAGAKRAKSSKVAERKSKKGETKAAPGKKGKPAKAGKK